MHIYDTLIIGSGYTALGYAIKNGNTLICEERESADTHFYLSFSGFKRGRYIAKTPEGKELNSLYEKLGLFSENEQNASGFECGFCSFAERVGAEILLKSRVIDQKELDGYTEVSVVSNAGIEKMFAQRVIDMRPKGKDARITLLFSANDISELSEVEAIFPESEIESAFYEGRYALHTPIAANTSYTDAFSNICSEWSKIKGAKMLYVAPVLEYKGIGASIPRDNDFTSPIEALEAGMKYAERKEKC